MPRTPRNPGSGKSPKNGRANGPGWGGPAQGAGKGGARNRITKQNTAEHREMRGAPEAVQRRYDRIAAKDEIHGFYTSVFKDEAESMLYRLTAAKNLEQGRYAAARPEDEEGTVSSGYVVAPPQAESIEAWTQQAQQTFQTEKSGDLNPDPNPSS